MKRIPTPPPSRPRTALPVEPYITKREVTRRLSVVPRTLERWVRDGVVPSYKIGWAVRFRWSEVQAALAAKRRASRREC